MTEGGATRMKRNSARLFKNPPQPHMCIQDFIQGAGVPCYVNVLSWDKVAMPLMLSTPLQFYGGMRVRPPRTKEEAVIFAVMANPEVLRISGKNAQDPKKRSSLIKLLLDFVERMNVGVVFTRQYTILKDRDITGELKEVWNAVQARRDVPPIPQYPRYKNHQQEYTSQPSQYHSSVAYGRPMSNEGMHYESYGHQPQNPVITQTDQIYQTGQLVPQQYHGNVPRITSTASRDRRDNIVPNMPQQNCPAYPAPQYQFQQLPRQMVPQYVNSNVHPNANLNYGPGSNANVNPAMNTNLAVPFQPYTTFEQRRDNGISMGMRRLQPQQHQQQQMHLNHVQPVPQYEPNGSSNFEQVGSSKVLRVDRPHMGVAQKERQPNHARPCICTMCLLGWLHKDRSKYTDDTSKKSYYFEKVGSVIVHKLRKPYPGVAQKKRQPTHSKRCGCTSCLNKDTSDNGTKPTNPVKVLQRELQSNDRQDTNNHITIDNNRMHADKILAKDINDIQVTDLDEEVKNNDFNDETIEIPRKPSDTHMSLSIMLKTTPDFMNGVGDADNFEQVESATIPRHRRVDMGVAQKKRQHTHSKRCGCTSCLSKDTSDNGTKPTNTVKVLQRELPSNDRQDTNNHITIDNNKMHADKILAEDMNDIQVTDLDEEIKKNNDFHDETIEIPRKSSDTHMSLSITLKTAPDFMNGVGDPDNFEQVGSVTIPRHRRPDMGVAQKKRQPTHHKRCACTSCVNKDTSDNGTKSTNPVKVLQRELPSNDRQGTNNHTTIDNNKMHVDKISVEDMSDIQVTDLDEEVKKNNDFDGETIEIPRKPNDTHMSSSILANTARDGINCIGDTPALEEKQHEVKNADIQNGKNSFDQKYSKSKPNGRKGNKHKENTENNRLMRNRLASDPKNDNPKRSQSTVDSIIKSIFKIDPGVSNDDTSSKRKTNGQAKNNAKINGEAEEAPQSYTILKKTESTTPEELASELARLTIQDCKDATEVSPVLS